MLSEYVQDLGYDLPMVFNHVSLYQDIVHIDCHVSFIDEVLEDVTHHGLEGGQAVGEAEEHDQGFETSKRPQFVQKVAFHSSPSLIHTLLYPQCTSSFIKYLALESEIWLIMSGTRGSG